MTLILHMRQTALVVFSDVFRSYAPWVTNSSIFPLQPIQMVVKGTMTLIPQGLVLDSCSLTIGFLCKILRDGRMSG